jgi:phosphinothricin acetyltransferase
MLIRDAAFGDLEAINEIYNHEVLHGTATWDYEPWPIERRREWFAERDETTPTLVAEADGRVAGYAFLSVFRPRPGYRHTREDSVYVAQSMRGQRIGDALLAAVVERARILGVRCVIGVIETSNLASIRLHLNHGFEEAGTVRDAGRKFGRWLDITTVQLVLPGPANPDA